MHKHQCLAHQPADVQFFTILELYGHTRKGDRVIIYTFSEVNLDKNDKHNRNWPKRARYV